MSKTKDFLDRLRKSDLDTDLLKDILQIVKESKPKKQNSSIAIVGLGCKVGGGINSVDELWDSLSLGKNGISDFPNNRGWDIKDYFHEDSNVAGKTYVKSGSFINDADLFDAQFFGISPTEAQYIDPQQRILLQVTYEAIENGGITLKELKNNRTGVFLGLGSEDYSYLNVNNEYLDNINFYSGVGNSRAVAAGRISYILGLDGPSLAVDTACSSSMTAVHLAVQSILSGECDYAIAGGVHLALSPHNFVQRCKLGTLSKSGECYAFDNKADGFSVGEGCGIVILKSYDKAIKDKNIIHGIIKASAANHNGSGGNGLTAPNGKAQVGIIKNCINNANIDPNTVHFIETHGAGTSIGDTIEYDSIAKTYCERRNSELPVYLGSIKPNFGHMEAAAGILSLIKTTMVVKNRKILPQRNFTIPNELIDWENNQIEIPLILKEWPTQEIARASVNSFGVGGSNIHMIIEEHPQHQQNKNDENSNEPLIYMFSGHTLDVIENQIDDFLSLIDKDAGDHLKDLSYSLAVRPKHHRYRFSAVSKNKDKLLKSLNGFKSKKKILGTHCSEVSNHKRLDCAFIFTGHGSQYAGMGKWMYDNHPTFKNVLTQCNDLFYKHSGISIIDTMFENTDEQLVDTIFAHPAIFSFEVALSAQLIAWGVQPTVLIGHSIGEYAAAHVAGIIALEDAVQLIVERSKLIDEVKSGKMMVIMASRLEVMNAIENTGVKLDIAAINGIRSIVVSGDHAELKKLEIVFENLNIETSYLSVSNAAHSVIMDRVKDKMKNVASKFTYHAPKIAMMSNLTGSMVDKYTFSGEYWAEHLRNTVLFHESVTHQIEKGIRLFIELGPKATLSPIIQDSFENVITANFSQPKFEEMGMLNCLSNLFSLGYNLDWESIFSYKNCLRVELPSYSFNKSRYWHLNPLSFEENSNNDTDPKITDWVYRIYAKALSKPMDTLQRLEAVTDVFDIVNLRRMINKELNMELSISDIMTNTQSIDQMIQFLTPHINNKPLENIAEDFDHTEEKSSLQKQFTPRKI